MAEIGLSRLTECPFGRIPEGVNSERSLYMAP